MSRVTLTRHISIQPTRAEQAASASAGAVLTSVSMSPLEVIKVRQQAAPTLSMRQVFSRMIREEGTLSLWNGLRPTLLMNVPSTVIYLTVYEEGRDRLTPIAGGAWAPLGAGGSARALVTSLFSPLELLRTRMQATGSSDGLGATAARVVRSGGVGSLWTGLGASLWRDVPFSCIYWALYEALRRRAKATHPQGEVTTSAAFLAGAAAGSVAALATTPLDVVKTRQQLAAGSGAAAEGVLSVVRSEGAAALFAGVVPRVARVAPANAIMISTYELGKRTLAPLRELAQSRAEECADDWHCPICTVNGR